MPEDCLSPTNDKISIKHKHNLKGEIFELGDFNYKVITPSDNDKCANRNSDPQSSENLTTKELISAISHAWGRAREPLSALLSKTNSACKTEVIFCKSTSAGKLEQERVEYGKNNQKITSPGRSYESFSFWRIAHARSTLMEKTSVQNFLSSNEMVPNLSSNYVWMNKIYPAKPKNQVKCGGVEDKTVISTCIPEAIISTCSESEIVHPALIHATDCENDTKETENNLLDCQVDERMQFAKEDASEVEISSPARQESQHALAKREHAFAGAMAGISVSLCLHPMDTIKTVIQSCRADQKPLCFIGRSIVSERGLAGLYRGISSNVVTSAPISAVYTYTYESVKKTLLPLLPKENHSFAHCIAGGCASIATSFIFTPSECIKQQMQVGSHYRNCWTALIEVVQKGGLPSLYTGWGAVLCRNVPHSVIKFYTYESLKEILSPSVQPNTLVTLVCGGLAGSMASLFTTPFDVVKTRLQTQIPGSITQYDGVFNTLTKIGKNEGLKGLYRGLTPRLVMYMIQGSLFFASYESFKRLFALEVP